MSQKSGVRHTAHRTLLTACATQVLPFLKTKAVNSPQSRFLIPKQHTLHKTDWVKRIPFSADPHEFVWERDNTEPVPSYFSPRLSPR